VAPVDGARIGRLVESANRGGRALERLTELCDTFGPRFSGSTNLEAAIDWAMARLKEDGFQNVRGEPVKVPKWVRGAESLEELSPRPSRLPVLALGGSVGTPDGGVTARVLVVTNFAELTDRADEARGRIVVFAVPFTAYGETVRYRTRGAIEASKVGAVACLLRSVTPFSLQTPHTGMMVYDEAVPRIPAAAVSVEDAERLRRAQVRGWDTVLRLQLGARTLPDVESRNVVADIPGRTHPEEIVLVGGHFDSWDVGQGALDDGGGCVAAWEALRLIRESGEPPRRTLRLILWANEENGLRGAKAYPEAHRDALPRHVLAIESDWGIGPVQGFAFTGSERANAQLRAILPLLEPVGAGRLKAGAGGSDLGPLLQAGVPVMDLWTDRRDYFWFHHSAADTVDKVDAAELNRCVAALAVMGYAVAEMPEPLAR
jgi:carboxypeptidase Q